MAAGRAPRRGSAILRQPRPWRKKAWGAPGKDRLSLGDDPGPGVGPVAEPPREVVGGLARARHHVAQRLVAEAVGRAADVERRDNVAAGRAHRRGDGAQPDLEL